MDAMGMLGNVNQRYTPTPFWCFFPGFLEQGEYPHLVHGHLWWRQLD